MVEAWETWLLTVYAVFQAAVAVWWWKGPYLPGTRGWGAALFGLNGFATFTAAVADPGTVFRNLGNVADIWTNLCQLGFIAAALPALPRMGTTRWPILIGCVLSLSAASWGIFVADLPPGWVALTQELPFLLAMVLAAPAIALQARSPSGPLRRAWLLVLGVLVFRHAEVEMVYFVGAFLESGFGSAWPIVVDTWLRLVAFASSLAAFAFLLLAWRRERTRDRAELEIALVFVVSGFILGALFVQGGAPETAIWFTLGLVRPVAFLAAQARLAEESLFDRRETRAVIAGTFVLAFALAGLLGAQGLWGLSERMALLSAVGFAFLGFPVARWVYERSAREKTLPTSPPSKAGTWSIEHERVPLPSDWRERVEAGQAAFRASPPGVQDSLKRLARWERIILALDAVPPGTAMNAYERSTPGLHFVTHGAYASIGPEIRRANARWQSILDELGLPRPKVLKDSDEALVVGTWGRAEGTESARARVYDLTPLGRTVAARLRERAGLTGVTPADLARVLGESFGDPAVAVPVRPAETGSPAGPS